MGWQASPGGEMFPVTGKQQVSLLKIDCFIVISGDVAYSVTCLQPILSCKENAATTPHIKTL